MLIDKLKKAAIKAAFFSCKRRENNNGSRHFLWTRLSYRARRGKSMALTGNSQIVYSPTAAAGLTTKTLRGNI